MTTTTAQLIDTSRMAARYEAASSDEAATAHGETVRVYAVTVTDFRSTTPVDRPAWLVERIGTSRWVGEGTTAEQTLHVTRRMPTPSVSSRFGDPAITRRPSSTVEHVGTVVMRDGQTVLRKTGPSSRTVQYGIAIAA